MFKGWKQEKIDPDDKHNKDDLRLLVRKRLAEERYVQEQDLDDATSEIVERSKVGMNARVGWCGMGQDVGREWISEIC